MLDKINQQEHPTDNIFQAIRKRRIALLQTLSRTTDAIGALVDLLDISPSDPEAWIELAELYHEQCLFSQAQFCFEEALTIVPTAWNVRRPHPHAALLSMANEIPAARSLR